MDFAVKGSGFGANNVVGSDTIIVNADDLRLRALQWYCQHLAAEPGSVLEIQANDAFSQFPVIQVLARLRGWARGRLGARHVTSPRLIFSYDAGTIGLPIEVSKARWHYVISLCAFPCALSAGSCDISLGPSGLAVYESDLVAEISVAGDSGAAEPTIIMDGLLW